MFNWSFICLQGTHEYTNIGTLNKFVLHPNPTWGLIKIVFKDQHPQQYNFGYVHVTPHLTIIILENQYIFSMYTIKTQTTIEVYGCRISNKTLQHSVNLIVFRFFLFSKVGLIPYGYPVFNKTLCAIIQIRINLFYQLQPVR